MYVGAWFTETTSNKSLDASGGSVFRIMTGPAMLEWIRAAASTLPLCPFYSDRWLCLFTSHRNRLSPKFAAEALLDRDANHAMDVRGELMPCRSHVIFTFHISGCVNWNAVAVVPFRRCTFAFPTTNWFGLVTTIMGTNLWPLPKRSPYSWRLKIGRVGKSSFRAASKRRKFIGPKCCHRFSGGGSSQAPKGKRLFVLVRIALAETTELVACERVIPNGHNKSLDRSGGSLFRIKPGKARVEWIRAARSTRTFDCFDALFTLSSLERRILEMMRERTIRIVAMTLVLMVSLTFAAGWDTVFAQYVWSDWFVPCALCCF